MGLPSDPGRSFVEGCPTAYARAVARLAAEVLSKRCAVEQLHIVVQDFGVLSQPFDGETYPLLWGHVVRQTVCGDPRSQGLLMQAGEKFGAP